MKKTIHTLYARIRPILYKMKVLKVLRKIFTSRFRARIATLMGLSGFDITETYAYHIPKRRVPVQVIFDGVNFIGDTQAVLGTSEAARSLIVAMKHYEIPVKVLEVPHRFKNNTFPETKYNKLDAQYNINLIHINPPELPYAIECCIEEVIKDKYSIGYWHWELHQFPEKWLPLIEALDEIWVASTFIQNSLQKITNKPILNMPLPIRVSPTHKSRADFNLPNEKFIFLCMFSPTSNVSRKNPFGVIDAFQRAFENATEDVILVVKTHHLDTDYGIHVRNDLLEAVSKVKGILVEKSYTRQATTDLINNCDCFVSLHRAEGFGLPIAEAMALQKPVIVTAYSGNLDFTKPETAYLVDYHIRKITKDDNKYFPLMSKIYNNEFEWAEPDVTHAAQLMRQVFDNRDEAREIGLRGQQEIQRHFSIGAVGQVIYERLQNIGL